MNIESASLPSLPPSTRTVESTSALLTEGGAISENFSGALITQIGLLTNIKMGDSSLQTPEPAGLQDVKGLQDVAGLPVGTVGTQDFVALLGNDLPSSYKVKDDVDHEAALVAVTDTLKYVAMGTTAVEKAAEAEQNIKDVIAMAVPVEQNTADVVEQSVKDGIAVAVPIQMNLKQANDKPGKKHVEGDTQMPGVEGGGLLAAVILPVVLPGRPGAVANNLAPAGIIKEETLLSFIKSSTVGAKPNQSAEAPDDALPSVDVVAQSVQGKQDINLKYFDNAGQAEKTGPVERQALNIEGEKTFPKIGVEVTQLNKPTDNKAEIPAMTKPLAHPEWNKDLGERIVWMSSRAIPAAEIRLNPQHLGPISVRVDVTDDRATVVFTAQHAATREAIEASMPKLREMMSAQQLNLVDVNVSQGSASDQGRSQAQNFAQTAEGRGQDATAVDGNDDVEQEIESGRAVVSKGLLSIYA